MAKEVTLIDGVQPGGTSAVSVYQSPENGGGTRITAFTASLITGSETYRVFIGTSASDENEIIPTTNISGPDKSSPFELISQQVPAGSEIFVQVSTGTTIAFRSTGIEF